MNNINNNTTVKYNFEILLNKIMEEISKFLRKTFVPFVEKRVTNQQSSSIKHDTSTCDKFMVVNISTSRRLIIQYSLFT